MLIRGVDADGNAVDILVESCVHCGALIDVVEISLEEHVRSAH